MQRSLIVEKIFDYLHNNRIELISQIPYSACRVIGRELPFEPNTVIIFAVPYYIGEFEGRNISLYSIPCDYHLYFDKLFEPIPEQMIEYGYNAIGCADKSPIDEVDAAVRAGLGCIGKNGLLITEKYGSYVFIGEIFTDIPYESDRISDTLKSCIGCGNCIDACPSPNVCLSAITQKKGELTEDEENRVIQCGSAWGCDICQTVCPMNMGIEHSPITYFRENIKPFLKSSDIDSIPDEEFRLRAYSWRKKKTILRNLCLLESKESKK